MTRRAFTLVEVLMAMVMVAVVLPVVMQGLSLALGLAGDSRQRTTAAMLAQAKLEELALTAAWQTRSSTGDFGADHPGYTWEAQVSDFDTNVRQIDVQVLWTQRARQRDVTLSTLAYVRTQ